ncbi:uncharacterized protein LOC106667002 isoform X2 [Cimex lectularius]|uniref:Uncharacterized protein n=1 Tax=Cimex lectularius TaxID=79782 RepID=A0A8I6RRB9_CIMLE|nr:uncharacterized protein LOC106667002 isoform X2 [Cimex lectularius]
MSLSVSTAIAHAVLSVSSAYAISQTSDCVFAVLGFVLYFINGILGIVAYGAASGVKVYKFYTSFLFVSLSLSLPLFVSQLYFDSGFPKSLTFMHFAPFIISLFTGTFRTHDHPLQILHLASMVYISLSNRYYYGITTAFSFVIAIYAIGPIGMILNTPSRDLFNYALSFTVYFLVQTLRGR